MLLFQQKGGLKQADVEAGLNLNVDFFMGLVNAINMGDLLNELANQIRPFEVMPRARPTRVSSEALHFLGEAIKHKKPAMVEGTLRDAAREARLGLLDTLDLLAQVRRPAHHRRLPRARCARSPGG